MMAERQSERTAETGYRIRPVERQDHAPVIRLLQAISDYTPGADQLESIWEAFIRQPHLIAVVATVPSACGDEIVGYGSLSLELKIRGGIMGHLEDIVVDDACRGRGVGSAIVNHLLDEAKSAGCYKISLECRAEKEAFYERLGFITTGLAMSQLIR